MTENSTLLKHFQIVKESVLYNLPSVFSKQQLIDEIISLKEKKVVPKGTNTDELINLLVINKLLEKIELRGITEKPVRFASGTYTSIELAFSLLSRSWISHHSALDTHELVSKCSNKIFVTQEQSQKVSTKSILKQEDVDNAFKKEQRSLNQIFKFKNQEYYLLKGKYSNRLGVIEMSYKNKDVFVTDIERTLIDCVVRPAYSGEVKTIIEAFSSARGKVDVAKMFNYLNQLNYIYPYHQSIGFFLEYTGYSAKDWSLFDRLPKSINFYLDYNNTNKYLNRRWLVYIPDQFSLSLKGS
jgi:hypothetical protein